MKGREGGKEEGIPFSCLSGGLGEDREVMSRGATVVTGTVGTGKLKEAKMEATAASVVVSEEKDGEIMVETEDLKNSVELAETVKLMENLNESVKSDELVVTEAVVVEKGMLKLVGTVEPIETDNEVVEYSVAVVLDEEDEVVVREDTTIMMDEKEVAAPDVVADPVQEEGLKVVEDGKFKVGGTVDNDGATRKEAKLDTSREKAIKGILKDPGSKVPRWVVDEEDVMEATFDVGDSPIVGWGAENGSPVERMNPEYTVKENEPVERVGMVANEADESVGKEDQDETADKEVADAATYKRLFTDDELDAMENCQSGREGSVLAGMEVAVELEEYPKELEDRLRPLDEIELKRRIKKNSEAQKEPSVEDVSRFPGLPSSYSNERKKLYLVE